MQENNKSGYLVLTGGTQRGAAKEEWKGYKAAKTLVLDLEQRSVKDLFQYYTPEIYKPEKESSIIFKSGSIANNQLLLCTLTEIIKFDLTNSQISQHISLPCFNDLHHVGLRNNGNFMVVSTGLDAVFEINTEGKIINEWSTIDASIWGDRFDPKVDYRKVATTKPHLSHPNFCFEYKNEIWVTRFNQKDCINLYTGQTLDIGVGNPHDGVVVGSQVYFTTTNCHIVGFNLENGQKFMQESLSDYNDTDQLMGWCRALLPLSSTQFIVGFSRIRPTKFIEHLEWIKRKVGKGFPGCLPTRIALYDIKKKKVLWQLNLEKHDIHAVFSALPLSELPASLQTLEKTDTAALS